MSQRWNHGRASYRPAGEVIDTGRYGVEVIDGKGSDNLAKAFIKKHHYSGSYPAACHRVGLYRLERGSFVLVGMCVFSVPSQRKAVEKWCGTGDGLVLGRFVLLDDVPANGESWFLADCFKTLILAKPGMKGVLSYSDPVPRTSVSGDVVMPGHVGTIYQAFNGLYHGRSKKETQWFGPDGKLMDRRSFSKIRNGEVGATKAYVRLVKMGAPRKKPSEEWAAYVLRAKRDGPFRKVRHPGNHVYTWPLLPPFDHLGRNGRKKARRRLRKELLKLTPAVPAGITYPKQPDTQVKAP